MVKSKYMNQKSTLRFNFDKIAGGYDEWYQTAQGAMYDKLEKKAFDKLLANYHNGSQLLEIGCGTGHWSRYFSDKGFEVTGIDISEQMVRIAGTKDIPNCRFHVADGQSLPFFNNSFDAAAAITTLEFAENPQKLISEMARCIKPGGRLLFGVLNSLSSYNLKRKKKAKSVYASARLFSPDQLKSLLGSFGTVKILIAGFVPQIKWLIWVSPLFEYLCRLMGRNNGAFIAAEVQL